MDLENLTGADADQIARNEGEGAQYHQQLIDGVPVTKSAVERAYAKANPERDQAIKDSQQVTAWTDAQKEEEFKSLQKQAQSAEQPVAQAPSAYTPTPTEIQVNETLTQEWGADSAANRQAGSEALREFFPEQAHFDRADNYLRRIGVYDHPEILKNAMRLVVELGKLARVNKNR